MRRSILEGLKRGSDLAYERVVSLASSKKKKKLLQVSTGEWQWQRQQQQQLGLRTID
jgi:hypothetical protein